MRKFRIVKITGSKIVKITESINEWFLVQIKVLWFWNDLFRNFGDAGEYGGYFLPSHNGLVAFKSEGDAIKAVKKYITKQKEDKKCVSYKYISEEDLCDKQD